MIKKNYTVILTYLFFSSILVILFIGIENINFTDVKWLFVGNDMSGHQTGWHFFKNDIWRFPLGKNPNYGDDVGTTIVYSDSIPLLAFIFKLLNPLLPAHFQYFGLWFFLCFFLQGLLSYLVIYFYTNNKIFSILSSLIFVFLPILIHRFAWHPALFGQWTLIITFFLLIENKTKYEKFWILLVLLTCLIHFYFTIINLIVYNISKVYSFFILKKINFKVFIKNIATIHISLLILMYIAGYFEVRIADTLAVGFGIYKINLLSLIDAANSLENIHWSFILPDIKLSVGEELEGFNFIGLGNIVLILLTLIFAFKKKNIKKNKDFFNKKNYLILLFLSLISLSNIISLGTIELINIPLNKYIYGVLSIARSSGRLFWFVNYFIIFSCLVLLYFRFKSNKAIWILLIVLSIQLIDTSNGIKNYTNSKKINRDINIAKDLFWYTETKNLDKIYSTYPMNYNTNFDKFSYLINEGHFKRTTFLKTARADRKKISEKRYKLYEDFVEKKIDPKTLYVIDNIGHLINLKNIFYNENVGFFFRDNIWGMAYGKKNRMTNLDIQELNNLEYTKLSLNEEKVVNFDTKSLLGMGWTHNLNKNGVWSEGKYSFLQFKIDKNYEKANLELEIEPFLTRKNPELNVDIYLNDIFNKNINFNLFNIYGKTKVKIKIPKNVIKNNSINIKFVNNNLVSPYDLYISPDSRKLSFLLTKITLLN